MTATGGCSRVSAVRWRRGRIVGAAAALAVTAAACGSAAGTAVRSSTRATQAAANAAPAGGGATVQVGQGPSGPVLVDAAGRTLYHLSADHGTQVACTGHCLTVWPPLVATASPTAGPGVTGTLGTITRADGTRQVTYNGLTLYTYVGDTAPGQARGQGLTEQSGGMTGQWTVVTPSASAMAPGAASTATTSAPVTTMGGAASSTTQAPAMTEAPTTTRAPTTTQPATTTTTAPSTSTTLPGTWG